MNRRETADFLEKCRWWFEPYTSVPEKWNETCDMAIAALQDNWIPVRKNGYVPDYEVMCQDKYGNMMIGYVGVDEYGDWMCEDDGTIMNDVIAWQPLPAPYKGDMRGGTENE